MNPHEFRTPHEARVEAKIASRRPVGGMSDRLDELSRPPEPTGYPQEQEPMPYEDTAGRQYRNPAHAAGLNVPKSAYVEKAEYANQAIGASIAGGPPSPFQVLGSALNELANTRAIVNDLAARLVGEQPETGVARDGMKRPYPPTSGVLGEFHSACYEAAEHINDRCQDIQAACARIMRGLPNV